MMTHVSHIIGNNQTQAPDTHLFFGYARGRADHAPVLDATPFGLPLADGDLALEHRQLKKRRNKELHEVSVPGAAAASW